jgi:hypothetical protein
VEPSYVAQRLIKIRPGNQIPTSYFKETTKVASSGIAASQLRSHTFSNSSQNLHGFGQMRSSQQASKRASVIMNASNPKVSGGTDVSLDDDHFDKEFNVAVCGATGNVGR